MTTLPFPVSNHPGRVILRSYYGCWPLMSVMLYLICILPIYVENNAGSGLNLPQNLLAWGCMVLFILLTAARAAVDGRMYIARFMPWAILAAALLMLPWLWTSSALWRQHALPRIAGIAGALLFALALCQVRLTGGLRRAVLVVVVISALVQATEAMMQAWLPDLSLNLMDFSSTSPYGIFQQRNLLASWLATGFGVILYLSRTALTRGRSLAWMVTLYPLSAGLVLSQSRVGALGALAMAVLSMVADVPHLRHRWPAVLRRVVFFSSLMVWCVGIGLWAMPSDEQADFSHPASTEQRLRVLAGTAELIAQHPLAGSGLGSFEAQFPQALAAVGLKSLESDTFTHPHNEVMYVMAEGGLTALCGLLLLAGIWLWPVVNRLSRRDGSWLLPLAGLPVVMHLMTEYPLYLSAPHLMLLLLLFRTGLPGEEVREVRGGGLIRMGILPLVCLACALTVTVLEAGFTTQAALTRAEMDMNAGLMPRLPVADWRSLTQAERLERDRHLLAANAPGFSRRPHAMAAFTVWGERWLRVHNDADVSAALIWIARYRGDHVQSERLRSQAARVFVHDVRFEREGA